MEITYQEKLTIKEALRFQFDHPKTWSATQIDIMEAMEKIDIEMYQEMKSDLISEGIITEN